MLSRRSAFAAIPLALAVTLLTGAAAAAGSWSIHPVATAGDFGGYVGVALDATGRPHMSYYDGNTGDLRYAVRTNGIWTTAVVDSFGDTGLWTSIVVDALGNPHISYFYDLDDRGAAVGNLKYATKSGGSWTVQTVDAGSAVGEYGSIALDSQGRPHISYYDNANTNLKHAFKSGTTWTRETVDASGNVGSYTSLDIDSQDRLYIAYQDFTNFALKYATKSGNNPWTVETAVPFVRSIYNSLEVDSQGNPHIVFYDEAIGRTIYATKPGTWTYGIARSLGEDMSGPFTSLAIDGQDVLHLAYFNNYTGMLSVGVKSGDYWLMEEIQPAGWWGALAVDPAGNPHVGFHDVAVGKVGYAVNSDIVSDVNLGGRAGIAALDAFPNPVRNGTTLVLRTPTVLPLALAILDARGRLVRSLSTRELPPGTHEFAWDGRDDAGNRVGGGIYFAVVQPGELGAAHKLVVIR